MELVVADVESETRALLRVDACSYFELLLYSRHAAD